MAVDFYSFVWLHLSGSEMDFLCVVTSFRQGPDEWGLMRSGYIFNRLSLLVAVIVLHTAVIVSMCMYVCMCACMYTYVCMYVFFMPLTLCVYLPFLSFFEGSSRMYTYILQWHTVLE
jgi:hypothetical protein